MSLPSSLANDPTIVPEPDDAATIHVVTAGARASRATPAPESAITTVVVDDRTGSRADARGATIVMRATGHNAPTEDATAASSDDSLAPVGDARYVVVGLAGRGGMGTVHVAHDVDLLRRVALKELAPEAAGDRVARARFVREVQVTAQLDHPHIVPVYGLEVAPGGRPAYAMKLVDGRTFAGLIEETRGAVANGGVDERHSLAARLEHFVKVCDAVAYAHARGVVHRDLKPANLMLGRHNEVYVMDWGICRVVQSPSGSSHVNTPPSSPGPGDAGETAFGAIVGTPLYMSPEQARGFHTELDARSDQCALGLILFELVTLTRPYSGKTLADVLQQAAAASRLAVAEAAGAAVPRELVAIIDRATACDPRERYDNVSALADDLRRFLRGDAVDARPDSRWQRLVRRSARHRQALALAMVALVVAVLGVGMTAALIWRHDRALGTQQVRERRLQAFVTDVGLEGDRLQTRLLEVRAELEALAATFAHAAEFGREESRAIRWADPTPSTGGHSGPAFGGQPQGEFLLSAGIPRGSVDAMARRLSSVESREAQIFLHVREVLGRHGTKVDSAIDSGLHGLRAGFENGLLYRYPSGSADAGSGDPRREPWYRVVASSPSLHWTPAEGGGEARPDLALTTPIRGSDGRLLGVLGLTLALDHILANLLADRAVPGAAGILLLDERGGVLAAHMADTSLGALDRFLKRLPLDAVLKAEASRDIGFVETDRYGSAHIVGFDRIHPLEWTLLAVADERDLPGGSGR